MARGRDGLYRREGGIFAFRYKDAGVWREKSSGQTNRGEAPDFRKQFLAQLEAGSLPTKKADQTVAAAVAIYVEHHRHTGAKGGLTSNKSRKNERSYANQLCRRMGTRKLDSITLDALKGYQTRRKASDKYGAGVKGRPINCELQILIGILKEANLWHGAIVNYKRLPETPDAEVGVGLTRKQKLLLETTAASRPAWEVAFLATVLAANTGSRGAEIKRLRLRDVDLERRQITIRHSKTPASNRVVELNRGALSAVTRLWDRARLLGARDLDHYLLPADLGKHTRVSDPLHGRVGFDVTRHQESWATAWRNCRDAVAEAIIEAAQGCELTFAERMDIDVFRKLGFHSMRRSFITWNAENGTPLSVTMKMVGHISPEMTQHYERISSDAQRLAVEKLDEQEQPDFVGKFVGNKKSLESITSKLLN